MRSFCPKFRPFLLAALCGAALLAAGCAHKSAAPPVTKQHPLFVNGTPKPDKPAQKPEPPPKVEPDRPKIDVKFDAPKTNGSGPGVTLRWSGQDGNLMTASFQTGGFNTVTQQGDVLDFSAQLYENGKLTASVRSPKATIDGKKHVILASGGVVLKSLERQTVVVAPQIKWYANKHRVIGYGGVRIKSASGTATCAAIVADTSLKTFTLLSSAKGLE